MVQPLQISVKMIDAAGRSTTEIYPIPAATTHAAALGYATALSLLVDQVLVARVSEVKVIYSAPLNAAVKAAPVAGSIIRDGGNIGFDAQDTQYKQTFFLGGINTALYVGKKDLLVTGAPATPGGYMADLIAALHGTIDTGVGLVGTTDDYGNDLTAFLSGAQATRRK